MNRSTVVACCLIASAFFASQRSGGPPPGPSPSPSSVAEIAESVQRDRAKMRAEAYEELAGRLDAGEFTDASSLGQETEELLDRKEHEALAPLQKSAASALSSEGIDEAEAKKAAAWYRAVAKGFREAGR